MRLFNIKLWGPFYVIGLLVILIMMWMIEEVRPKGLTLWVGTILILVAVIFNFYMIYNEIKVLDEKTDKNRELSGLEPLPKKKWFSFLRRE